VVDLEVINGLRVTCTFYGRGGSMVGSVPSVGKVAGLNSTLAATWGPRASPSLVVACMT